MEDCDLNNIEIDFSFHLKIIINTCIHYKNVTQTAFTTGYKVEVK